MLKIKKLHDQAISPTVSHPGEDLGFDLYALEDAFLLPGVPVKVHTGIAAVFQSKYEFRFGLLIRDRSSMAARGIMVSGGVIDSGYRGEIIVMLTLSNSSDASPVLLKAGEKIAQMIPLPVLTGSGVEEVKQLPEAQRGGKGFGSTGR